MDAAAYQRAQTMMQQAIKHFRSKVARFDSFGDAVRFRFAPGKDVYLDYQGQIACERGRLNEYQLHILQELEFFVANEHLWYTLQDVRDRYYAYDLVIARLPDSFYPLGYPQVQYDLFDAARPYQRLIGVNRRASGIVNGLSHTFSDIVPLAALNFMEQVQMATDYTHSLGLHTYVIASPPYDQPSDGLIYYKRGD